MRAIRQIARIRNGLSPARLALALRASAPRRALAPCLIAVALLLRLAVPAGWMPAADGFGIAPCAGYGAMPIAAAKSGHGMHHGGGGPESKQDHSCPFAGFGAALAEPQQPAGALAALIAIAAPLVLPISAADVGHGLAAPPPPPTGPPALA